MPDCRFSGQWSARNRRHKHPDHGCGCEWDDTWRMVWAPSTEPGAVPITAMRHPAALVAAVGIPNPDEKAHPRAGRPDTHHHENEGLCPPRSAAGTAPFFALCRP
ncbi:hypothetical protein GCM10010335_64250 [Streptomyces galbus]|nr:hypothetical protein GCM10010335_64250 [Streptomyces galbus]